MSVFKKPLNLLLIKKPHKRDVINMAGRVETKWGPMIGLSSVLQEKVWFLKLSSFS